LTFDEWQACVSVGGCPNTALDGARPKPVLGVNFDDAARYSAWLSAMTGENYRLLSEAEWEYAARGGTTTVYFWRDEIGKNHANCNGSLACEGCR